MENVVSIKWLREHLHDPRLIILDATIPDTITKKQPIYPNLKIKGARFFDIKGMFSDADATFPNTIPSEKQFTKAAQEIGIQKDSIIVVYDALGIYSSPRAWWLFKVMGHKQVAVLDGGLNAYINAGLPTEPLHTTAIHVKGNFEASLQPQWIVSKETVLHNLNTKEALVIDARNADRFSGQQPEPRPQVRSGHIPHSKNCPYTTVLSNGHFASIQEIQAILSSLKIDTSTPLIFSCGSGITACILLLAFSLVTPNPKAIYDGSWTEWGSISSLPIAVL